MAICAILLAAGKGCRYKGTKQNEIFHGKQLWQYPFETLANVVGPENIVVVGRDIQGGDTRSGSVMNGLRALPADTSRVIIAEAARPLVTEGQVEQLAYDKSPSTAFVRPLVNTVMYRDGRYLNRDELYDLLTPQAFDCRKLKEAYASGRYLDMTDETRVMYEFHGVKPHLLETGSNLFKVTYPGDLSVLETIYQQLNGAG